MRGAAGCIQPGTSQRNGFLPLGGCAIHDFFHRLTCDSVGQFAKEQQRVIQEKNHALRQTGEAHERHTRTVSHELLNVLNALTSATTLLGEEINEEERLRWQRSVRGYSPT